MHIGDPGDLLKVDGFTLAYAESCRKYGLIHKKFLGQLDRFAFNCRRGNACCKNFSPTDRIIVEPYDVLRLSRKLKITTAKFMGECADLTLDEHTHFPLAMLRLKGNDSRNKCFFLRSYGCSVYEDRPLRCRLYPLGRILYRGKSYFIHIDNCKCHDSQKGRSWSVREWIDACGAHDYLEYQRLVGEVFSCADEDKYRSLNEKIKLGSGKLFYDIDKFLKKIPDNSRPLSDREIMLDLKRRVEDFLFETGCLERNYKTRETVELIARTGLKKSEIADCLNRR
ncbi:MAG: YkgJ family cysteine cluster protein [Candidatus Zixiibacteriota bacterium]|nr:MAG: YkgJ family cysteine cluster protein [candidate division Zixibacteria bacterium]